MNKKIAMEWVSALRSGDYKQGRDKLYDLKTDSYCCLGVLQKITGCDTNAENESLISGDILNDGVGFIESLNMQLSMLNDGYYVDLLAAEYTLNFDEIADLIQIFYEEL